VFELTTFRLAPGVDEGAFRRVDERVQVEIAYHQPGFVRRSLGRHPDGRWLIVHVWAGREQADAGRVVLEASPIGLEFFSMLTDVAVERFDSVG
jgi:hypothetical protein